MRIDLFTLSIILFTLGISAFLWGMAAEAFAGPHSYDLRVVSLGLTRLLISAVLLSGAAVVYAIDCLKKEINLKK